MTRIASSVQHQSLLAELNRANAQLFNTQQQISSGKVATTYKEIASETGVLLSAKRVESRTEHFQLTNTELLSRVDLQDVQLSQMADVGSNLRQVVLDAIALEAGPTLIEEINAAFEGALGVVNSQQDGKYIFGGTRTDTAPVNVSTLSGLAAAATVGDIFDNNTLKPHVEIDEGQTIQPTFAADEISTELFGVIKRLAEFNAGPSGPFTPDLSQAQKAYLESELAALTQMTQNIHQHQARNGLFHQQITKAQDRHDQSLVTLKQFISDIEDADLPEAITRLNQDQVATQAAAQILSQLRSVTLLEFL